MRMYKITEAGILAVEFSAPVELFQCGTRKTDIPLFNEQVKLCDFGFTREYEKQKLLQTFCGTVCYSAPEMLKGEKYMAYGKAQD